MALVAVIPLDRCRTDGGTFVEHAGFELAVFRRPGRDEVYVIDNRCPHAAGNLSGGDVEGTTVTCASHHWTFDLESGVCVDSPLARVRRYPAEVRDGTVWIDLPVETPAKPGPGRTSPAD